MSSLLPHRPSVAAPLKTDDREFLAALGRQVRERLLLERRIAMRHGFGCFADYFADRRVQGWGLNRLARETGQTRDWVRGVMRRYGAPSANGAGAARPGTPRPVGEIGAAS